MNDLTNYCVPASQIKIVQYMYGDFGYYSLSEKINRQYAERHGYQYVVSREAPRQDRHVTWQKLLVIMNELRDCDYLLWVDADAIFYSQELKIEHELIPLMEEFFILFPADIFCENIRWNTELPCTGVILIKNCDIVHEILKTWNNVSEIDEETRWTWPPEQIALWRAILPVYRSHIKILVDYYQMNGNYGQFIRHYPRMTDQERAEAMNDFCRLRGYH